MPRFFASSARVWIFACFCLLLTPVISIAQTYQDNQTQYSNQDPDIETRRSTHFRHIFGHYNRDTAGMTEEMVQGNLQMFEHMWDRWVTELSMHNINDSATNPDSTNYKANFNFLMTFNDGGGGGAYSSMDGNGFFYAMANPGYCRFDPPSGATPHEFGHAWEGTCGGFNGSDSSGAWWECTANWMQLQFLNSYPQAGGLIWNSMYYPCHGRDYYDTWTIWEAARDDNRFGTAWVNRIWTDYNADQQAHEYIIERMLRVSNNSGELDNAGVVKDLWGDMAKKCITWDYARQRWLAQANSADDGSDWYFYQRCRTPLVKVPGASGWYRPERSHLPMEYGFNMIQLSVTAGTTVSCTFKPMCDPVRQSDWRASLVAVSTNGDARYSTLWNDGTNSITLSADETKLYLVVIATPKPIKFVDPVWQAYLQDAGLQFPYAVSFNNATPLHIIYPVSSHTGMVQHANGGGWKASTATVDATAYLGPNAQVLNTAQVKGYARVEDYAVVRNSAQVRDNAVVSGHAVVQDNAKVYGNAKVRDWARVFGYAEIYDNARVTEHANIGDGNSTTHNKAFGNAVVKGTTYVYDTSTFQGCIIVDGDTANGNGAVGATGYVVADHGVHFGWQWGENTAIFNQLTDNQYVYAQHDFERDNPIFAMDKYGINHGFLMGGCKSGVDSDRGGYVLPLNGTDQYVELHNSLNDFRETAYTIWAKWTGTGSDQRIWSMGDGASKQMYLTPMDSTTGKLRFVISNGATTQYLDGSAALPQNTWTHIAVTFGTPVFNTGTSSWSATATLYVNGAQVASSAAIIVPDSLNAALMENSNYIGRGNSGNYFQGYIDDFRTYMKTLSAAEVATLYSATSTVAPVTVTPDTVAPAAATWLSPPVAVALGFDSDTFLPSTRSDNAVTMSARPGIDSSNWVEYYFTCTSGAGHDSGWVSFNKYTDNGLTPSTTYTYTVKYRDRNGNVSATSAPMSATTAVCTAPTATFSYGPIGIAGTSPSNGQVKMVATKFISPSGLTEYKFDRCSSTGTVTKAGTYQSSPTFIDTGLSNIGTYYYKVSVRDGRGNVTTSALSASTMGKDLAPPLLPDLAVAHWQEQPYATIDNKISMTAQPAVEGTNAQFYYKCVSGGGPDSGWINTDTSGTPKWTTTNAVADGTYVYQYQIRDKNTTTNVSTWSSTSKVTVSNKTGYHSYTLTQLAALPDDTLVTFTGYVSQVNATSYAVKDLPSGTSILVKPNNGKTDGTTVEATDATLKFKNVTVKGHLYTYGTTKYVTFSTVTYLSDPPTYAISGKVTNAGGTAISGATVYLSDSPNPSVSPVYTVTTDASGNYTKSVVSGTWYVAAIAGGYNLSADRIVTVNTAAVPNINFTLVGNARILGKVVKRTDQSPISGASVYFSTTPGASGHPQYTATTDASGNYTQPVPDGTWYISAGKTGFYTSSDKTAVVAGSDVSGINFDLKSSTRNIPRTSDLLFSAITESLPSSGSTGAWTPYLPSGTAWTMLGAPTVDTYNGMKWAKTSYTSGDGFRQGTYSSPIALNGATVCVAVKPTRNSTATSWISVVDCFYDRLVLGVMNDTGKVVVRRNGSTNVSGSACPDGQISVLSLVVQPDGSYSVYRNSGTLPMLSQGTITGGFTSLVNGTSPNNTITIGKNESTNTTAYNGDIGDIFVYKIALSSTERAQLEADIENKFMTYTITAIAGPNGSISPSGNTTVDYGQNLTYNITPNQGYAIDYITIDGISQGSVSTWTFTNITAGHTIYTAFTPLSYTITPSAGAGGTISPSTPQSVTYGGSATFSIAPNSGYVISSVKVDGVSVGVVSSYTFTNVAANHTIDATFTLGNVNITSSVNSTNGGSVDPAGVTSVAYGSNQTYTFSARPGYVLVRVMVDGVNNPAAVSAGSYTFTNATANHTIVGTFAKRVLTIADLKKWADNDIGTVVYLPGVDPIEQVIYAPLGGSTRLTDFFYIGEKPALGGFRVIDSKSVAITSLNQTLTDIIGTFGILPSGEGCLTLDLGLSPVVGSVAASKILPFAMNNKSILHDPMTMTNSIKTWGKVMSIASDSKSFTMTDGSGAEITVMANGITLPGGFAAGKTAIVSGVLSMDGKLQAQSIDYAP